MKNRIIEFWSWFDANKDDYANFVEQYGGDYKQMNSMLDKLITELQKCSEGLFVEIGGKEAPWELIITPQGVKHFFAAAYEVVLLAPKYDDWTFFATKPAYGRDFNFQMGEIVINPDSISFIPLQSEDTPEEIAIRVYHKDYTEEESPKKNTVVMGVYQGLDSLLGEVATTFEIEYLEFASMPEEGVKPLPLPELVGYIKWKKKERAVSEIRFPEEEIALLRGEREAKPMMVLVNKALKYYEYKMDFSYLLLVEVLFNDVTEEGFPKEKMDGIYAIEDFIHGVVCKGEKGHFISTETFDGSRKMFYAGQSKAILEKQISQLQTDLKSPYQIKYKIFYDPFWIEASAYM